MCIVHGLATASRRKFRALLSPHYCMRVHHVHSTRIYTPELQLDNIHAGTLLLSFVAMHLSLLRYLYTPAVSEQLVKLCHSKLFLPRFLCLFISLSFLLLFFCFKSLRGKTLHAQRDQRDLAFFAISQSTKTRCDMFRN